MKLEALMRAAMLAGGLCLSMTATAADDTSGASSGANSSNGAAMNDGESNVDRAQSRARDAASTARQEMSDAALTTKVKAALIREKDLSALDINVETEDGVVQLSGFVERQDQIDRAEKAAESVEGVKSVKNDLRLKSKS